MDFRRIRRDLQESDDGDIRRRRYIALLSAVGLAAFVPIVLRQVGLIRHLPDPPLRSFNSDKINLSDSAFRIGIPDGALGLIGYATTAALAVAGSADRAERQPLLPVAAGAKAALEAVVASWYFYQMPAKEKAWCGYCLVGQFASLGTFALSLPEALRAWRAIRS